MKSYQILLRLFLFLFLNRIIIQSTYFMSKIVFLSRFCFAFILIIVLIFAECVWCVRLGLYHHFFFRIVSKRYNDILAAEIAHTKNFDYFRFSLSFDDFFFKVGSQIDMDLSLDFFYYVFFCEIILVEIEFMIPHDWAMAGNT